LMHDVDASEMPKPSVASLVMLRDAGAGRRSARRAQQAHRRFGMRSPLRSCVLACGAGRGIYPRCMGRVPLADRSLEEPHPSRLDATRPDRMRVLAAHAAAMQSGAEGYVDPTTGFFVFTAAWLAERGSCCDAGCRHCPYLS
jgi:Family of unknown function (DUF5522)